MGSKLSIANNTCHLCKSIITVEDCHPCKNKNMSPIMIKNKKNKNKKPKNCNKLFCRNCYEKHFPSYFINSKFNTELNCPSCEGLCNCKICLKNKERQQLENDNLLLLGNKRNISGNNNLNNRKDKKEGLIARLEKMGNKIRSIFPNIDNENKYGKDKNSKVIPVVEPNEFSLLKQYSLNLTIYNI